MERVLGDPIHRLMPWDMDLRGDYGLGVSGVKFKEANGTDEVMLGKRAKLKI